MGREDTLYAQLLVIKDITSRQTVGLRCRCCRGLSSLCGPEIAAPAPACILCAVGHTHDRACPERAEEVPTLETAPGGADLRSDRVRVPWGKEAARHGAIVPERGPCEIRTTSHEGVGRAVGHPGGRQQPPECAASPGRTRAAQRYGDVVALGRCPRPLYLINHPTLIQQILDQPAHYTKGPSVSRITPLFGAGLTTSDGALWRHQRPLLTTAWQAYQRADLTLIVAAATTEILARWQPHAQSGQPLDLTAALEDVTWTLMLRVLFGPDTPDPGPRVRAAMRTALAATNRRIWALWAL